MTMQNLSQLLSAQAHSWPDKACVITSDGHSRLTYAELQQHADAFAATLAAQGCRPGDSVLLGLGNNSEFFIALFGCFRLGLTAVPVDANLALAELEVIAGHASPRAIVVDSHSCGAFAALPSACPLVNFEQQRQAPADGPPPTLDCSPGDAALMLYTSGTTGNPKAVLYTHAMLLSKMDAVRQWFDFDPSYTSLCILPTHFGHGLICNCLSVFAYGGTLVIAPPFNLDLLKQLWSIVAGYQVNYFSSVPTILRLLLEYGGHQQAGIPSSLKFMTCASAPLPPRELAIFEQAFQAPVLNCYGLTETSGWSTCSPRDPARDLASVGKVINGSIRVVDEQGKVLAAGEKGELQISGPSVMSGYHDSSGATTGVLQDGWFATGDIGEINADGAVFLHARAKELIIRAGKNIYPAEVDNILMSHPEVAEACAVGLEDKMMGEKVAACVVLSKTSSLGEGELIQFSQQKLAAYKCPQRVLFVDKIPKNARGKVNRLQLRSLFAA